MGGRCDRISSLSERVVVVWGEFIVSGRSGIEAAKRIIRYKSCSGSALGEVMAAEFEMTARNFEKAASFGNEWVNWGPGTDGHIP